MPGLTMSTPKVNERRRVNEEGRWVEVVILFVGGKGFEYCHCDNQHRRGRILDWRESWGWAWR